ncbi:hypothetical protein LX32DRAFT_644219 [Colletotrichum zoysiae]|uniref:Uncharacterized protein n=1 Tax=Colletotrichum zoysiae TaxID=1216348 RepID=A0AAD9H7C2_9PEZI|nr:hypothetical protein LX32DRAFT_644219 [Colletotrichum zoysiae]
MRCVESFHGYVASKRARRCLSGTNLRSSSRADIILRPFRWTGKGSEDLTNPQKRLALKPKGLHDSPQLVRSMLNFFALCCAQCGVEPILEEPQHRECVAGEEGVAAFACAASHWVTPEEGFGSRYHRMAGHRQHRRAGESRFMPFRVRPSAVCDSTASSPRSGPDHDDGQAREETNAGRRDARCGLQQRQRIEAR